MSTIHFEDVSISGSYNESCNEREDSFEVGSILRSAMGIADEEVECQCGNTASLTLDNEPVCEDCFDETYEDDEDDED